ncbi:hypothetical protein CDD81_1279 [Ophiocordyceps australis]|uniref:Isopenicillin N synthase-like Fe(2+) 2OG dioxygenase domain-containing protein n=1 Tax=Ophiocordyceps australis TaxID=1399860 RepID=A0A2C5Y1I6_9HYPO|nr:hypothetical protein CDD81_1279 [Ophiocordyceps australis]
MQTKAKDMELPVIDLDVYMSQARDPAEAKHECDKAADALITYGALILRDSRVDEASNDKFLGLLEDYFAQPVDELRRDERPELSYQIGVTLENKERPKCAVSEPCLDVIRRLEPLQRPLDISGHEPDPKCRFFWRMAHKGPFETEFPVLNAENVTPRAPGIRERWGVTMDSWGTLMKNSVENLSEMVAVGLGLDKDYFVNAARYGPHLLAPTASDLTRHGQKDTILAGFHTDLNFLTIHGRSRYPGLNIWARNTGRRIAVKMPPGNYLLVQAGKQLEHCTGGLVKAGYHEVVVNEQTMEAVERRRRDFPARPLIRISSTLFWHLGSDFDLTPVERLAERARALHEEQVELGRDEGEMAVYAPIKVGELVQNELRDISLMA